MSNLPKKPTILDIADYLGISHSTVSRALNGKGRISEETRERIHTEAQRLGYKPNHAALALRFQSSNLVGFLTNSFFSHTIDELFMEIQHQAHGHNYGILTGSSAMSPQAEIDLLRFMASKQVEGLILQSIAPDSLHFQEELQRLLQENITVVHLLDSVAIPGVYSVVVDNQRAGYLAGRHLLDLGHQHILFLADDFPDRRGPRRFSTERYAGLLHAYQDLGLLRPQDLVIDEHSEYPGYEAVNEALDRRLDFTAIFACSDRVALGAMIALKERGHKVPGNCSVVGFADSCDTKDFMKPSLTTVRLPYDQVGAAAIKLILDKPEASAATAAERVVTLAPTLVERDSTLPLEQTEPIRSSGLNKRC